jgi:predicted DNA-binding protein
MATKVMTVRLSEGLAAELAVVARTDDMPVSESVREAIERHIASRRADKDFQRRLKKRLEQEREILKRFAE